MNLNDTSSKNWKSLGFVISFPFALLVIVSFAILGFLAFYSSQQSMFILVNQLTTEASNKIKINLTDYFETPPLINQINNDLFANGEMTSAYLFENPEKFFFKRHAQFPSISDIYFSKKDGAIAGIDKSDGKYLLKLTSKMPSRDFFLLDNLGNRKKITKSDTYNSLERDWYKKAVSENKTVWSNIYVLKNKNKLGITSASPTYNQNREFEGVMGVNLTLDGISEFLKNTKVSPNATMFIIEKNGDLVASSSNETLFKNNNGKLERVKATEIKNNIIKSSVNIITTHFSGLENSVNNKIIRSSIDDENYLIQVSNFKDKFGLDFLIVNAVNEIDFMGEVYHTFKIASAIALLIVAILILLGYFISKIITKPIKILSVQAENIASGDLGKLIEISTDTKEIKILVNTFNSMSKQLQESFNNLEQKVDIRTQELLNSQKILQDAHKNIRDSISYGSLIQHTILPDTSKFDLYFSDYLAIWKPKDVVGGDIYLFEEIRKDECLLMVIDCTGHGVPGAFVTMLVKAIERQITNYIIHNTDEIISPAKILQIFNKTMKHLLNQDSEDSVSNAGFDGGVLYFNKKQNIIKYSGAETPLFYTQNGELKTIKGDRCSVGYKKSDANYEFKEHVIEAISGMQFYLTTDGYLDQNGGEKDFPFGTKKFKKIIENNLNQPMNILQQDLLTQFQEYKGQQDQNDDITIVAVKI